MATCTRTSTHRRSACIGAMDRRITLQARDLTPPPFGSVDFDEAFSGDNVVWASVRTVRGKTFFDEVNTVDREVTHEVTIRYDATVDAEVWIHLDDGRRLDILRVDDLDERHEWLVLTCTDKGASKV